jgi:FixJ family two-component response regulator
MISIVDDDESFRRATTRFVKSLGYAVAAFASAEEFIRSDRLGETACLISDVQMPGMSGIELYHRLRQQGWRAPVIFVTAFSRFVQGQALEAGALGVLNKPFEEDQLISYLSQAISGQKA